MDDVQPIPEGFHTVTPHLTVSDAAAAIDFYKRAFGATEKMRMTGPGGRGVMHAEIVIGDSIVFLADDLGSPGMSAPEKLGAASGSMNLYLQDVDAAFKQAVEAGASVMMPVGDMFWGDRYGLIKDPFGQVWGISTHIKDMTEAEMAKASEEFFAQAGQSS